MADVEARQFQEGWDMNANRDEQDSGGVVQEWAGWFRDCPALTPLTVAGLLTFGGAVLAGQLPEGFRGLWSLIIALFLGLASQFVIRDWLNEINQRLVAVGVLCLVGLLQVGSTLWIIPHSDDPARNWDTIKNLGFVLGGVPVFGAFLILMPLLFRKVILICLVCFHFVGILSAVTSVDPPGTHAPWVSTFLWVKIYRPYLHFLYMNNAYHFYSPEPGPATLVWYRIDYSDGKSRWIRIPHRGDSPLPLLYQRTLSVGEAVNMANGYTPVHFYSELLPKRTASGLENSPQIPPLPSDIQSGLAYREPQPHVKSILSSYARHVAKNYAHPEDNPKATITKIRIYRITHSILAAPDLARGVSPLDPSTFIPYFYGDYDANGKMLDDKDGFLWFAFPIYNAAELRRRNPDGLLPSCLDYFVLHSGLDLAKEKK